MARMRGAVAARHQADGAFGPAAGPAHLGKGASESTISVKIPQEILRSYDVRGAVPALLSPDVARAVGCAFGRVVLRHCSERSAGWAVPRVAVGRDGRLSSPDLADGLACGLRAAGVEPVDLGLVATPELYFAQSAMGMVAAVMVTASHNPPETNGFKFVLDGRPFHGVALASLADERFPAHSAACDRVGATPAAGSNTSRRERYISALLEAGLTPAGQAGATRLRVVWDAGNGAIGPALEAAVTRLPGTHLAINTTVDGRFPVHSPDPGAPCAREALREAALRFEADLGLGFDGDGDRMVAVTATGEPVESDDLMALFAEDVLASNPQATVVVDIKASDAVHDAVRGAGGRPVLSRSGHAPAKDAMRAHRALFGGEVTGHYYFADRYLGIDDGLYAAVRLIDIVAKHGLPLACLLARLPRFPRTPELSLAVADEDKARLMGLLARRVQEAGRETIDLDGVRASVGDGWWLVRPSNTSAALSVRAEARSEAGLAAVRADLRAQLTALGLSHESV